MNATTYSQRRTSLREALDGGVILLLSSQYAPRNYSDNTYPFRQDSHFLYYVGVSQAGMAALLWPDGRQVLFGHPETEDDLVWHGPRPTLDDFAEGAGFSQTADMNDLGSVLQKAQDAGEIVHYLPPYRAERTLQLGKLLQIDPRAVAEGVSIDLMKRIVDQRLIKTEAEIEEIEKALEVTAEMYAAAMAYARPGRTEAEVAAKLQLAAFAKNRQQAFNPIVSVRGEVLHNTSYANTLEDGDLLLIDSGCESPRFYASDITRTFPVSGIFSEKQREIYEIVLGAQMAAIEAASPLVSNRDLHFVAARTIAAGLKDAGIMKGDVDKAVKAGAHALFYPHGIGHMLGQDVHDMEDLGDIVGYAEGESRSEQFGLAFLRLTRKLEPGFVITIEPGIYFIPALISMWEAAGKHQEFINYDRLGEYRRFGGIRIEDDILITKTGARVLGPGIPKTVAELEAVLKR